eukprot:3839239-Rhodomonas_salina.1
MVSLASRTSAMGRRLSQTRSQVHCASSNSASVFGCASLHLTRLCTPSHSPDLAYGGSRVQQ